MKRVCQQLIAAWLALVFASAGCVGLNPLLHQWVEHGGQGPAHTHRHDHDHGHGHPHAHGHVHSHAHASDRDDPTAASDEPLADHEHGSLAQLLANGLVDLSVGIDFDPAGAAHIVARVPRPHELPQVRTIDLLRAGRGPPCSYS